MSSLKKKRLVQLKVDTGNGSVVQLVECLPAIHEVLV